MAISRYDSPAQAEFMQTYVPVPFEELMQAGAVQQQRWEDSEAASQEVQSIFGNIPSLNSVTLSTGEVLEVGNAKHVQAKVDEFQARLDEISSNFSNKASVEHRAALKALITDLRKEQGSSGLFGKSAADVAAWQKIQEQIEEAKLGSTPHRAVYSDLSLRQFADASQRGYTQLSGTAPILEEVNIAEELGKTLGKMESTLIKEGYISRDELDQIRKTGNLTGKTFDRVKTVARRLILQDPKLRMDLEAQAEYYGQDVAKLIDETAYTMALNFYGENATTSWANDPVAAARRASQEYTPSVATRLNMRVPGRPFKDMAGLTKERMERAQQIEVTREAAINDLVNVWGVDPNAIQVDPVTGELKVDAVGIPVNETGGTINEASIGRIVFQNNMAIAQNRKALEDVERHRRNLFKQAEVTEEEFEKLVEELTPEVLKKFSLMGMPIDDIDNMPIHSILKYIPNFFLKDHFGGMGTRKDVVEQKVFEMLVERDDRFKKIAETLEKEGEDNTAEVRAFNVPKPLQEVMQKNILDFGLRGISVEWADDSHPIRELDEKEKNKYLKENAKYPPKFTGNVYVDTTSGKVMGIYNVYDKNGNLEGHVKADIPEGGEVELYRAGMIDEANIIIQNKVYNAVDGILGPNGVGTGVLDLAPDFQPEIVSSSPSGEVHVVFPVKVGDSMEAEGKTFDSVGEMINALISLRRLSMGWDTNANN